MKLKLTPQLSYLIGLWKYRRSAEGLGAQGLDEMCQVFAAELVNCGIAKPEEVKVEGGKVYTYHSAYRKFFEDTLARQDEVFKYNNDYSAAFYAGLFDAVGGENAGKVFLARADNADEICLMRMNWKVVRTGGKIWIGPADQFRAWIRQYKKVELPQKMVEASGRSTRGKIERRPRRAYPMPPPPKKENEG